MSSSTTDFYKMLSADKKAAAQIPLSPAKRSHPSSPMSSSPAQSNGGALLEQQFTSKKLVTKKPKTSGTATKDVNREMKELFAQGKLNGDAVLNSAEKTVADYLIEKWLQSQKLKKESGASEEK